MWERENDEREDAVAILKEHETELRQLGVEHLYLFGSTAGGEAREDSDVDLFFDYEKGKLGVFELMDVKEQTSRILGRKADIMTRDSLHRVLRSRIEASALQVFWWPLSGGRRSMSFWKLSGVGLWELSGAPGGYADLPARRTRGDLAVRRTVRVDRR
jgi:predicted nucleotidyltransferase